MCDQDHYDSDLQKYLASGAVTLQTVPPGDYVVAVWHETLGTLVKPVTVPPSGTATLEFAYQAPQ